MANLIISWTDDLSGQTVIARMRTEDAAIELASVMSAGDKATVTFDDGITLATWRFVDGVMTNHTVKPHSYDLGHGWWAKLEEHGGMTIWQLSGDDRQQFDLDAKQVDLLRNIVRGEV